MRVEPRPPPAVPTARVALPRRPNTEEIDEIFEISSDALLAMSDTELYALLVQLGINLQVASGAPVWSRDKMIDLVMKIALSARDV